MSSMHLCKCDNSEISSIARIITACIYERLVKGLEDRPRIRNPKTYVSGHTCHVDTQLDLCSLLISRKSLTAMNTVASRSGRASSWGQGAIRERVPTRGKAYAIEDQPLNTCGERGYMSGRHLAHRLVPYVEPLSVIQAASLFGQEYDL